MGPSVALNLKMEPCDIDRALHPHHPCHFDPTSSFTTEEKKRKQNITQQFSELQDLLSRIAVRDRSAMSLAEFLEDFTSETSAMQGLKFDSALIAISVGECTANC